MAVKGHEEHFSSPTLSARYVIRQETFAGTHGNGGEVAETMDTDHGIDAGERER